MDAEPIGVQDSSKAGTSAGEAPWRAFSRGSWDWMPMAIFGAVLAGALWSFDGPISAAARRLALSGDVKRELDALAQYGQGSVSVIVAIVIASLEPERRRRLIDWACAALIAGVTCAAMKVLIGRPRPLLEDPGILLGPWGMHPVPTGEPGKYMLAHAWEMTSRVQYALGSMPSRHATFAASLSAVLWTMYPRLLPLAAGLMALVAGMRVVTGAHYPSDVVIGLALGAGITTTAMRRFWGTRALDWLWRTFVDRGAAPALGRVVATEIRRLGPRA